MAFNIQIDFDKFASTSQLFNSSTQTEKLHKKLSEELLLNGQSISKMTLMKFLEVLHSNL